MKTRVIYSCRSITAGPKFLSVRSVIVCGLDLSFARVLIWVRVRLLVFIIKCRFVVMMCCRCWWNFESLCSNSLFPFSGIHVDLIYILRSFFVKVLDELSSAEKVYFNLTLQAKSAKVVLRFWVGSGLLGMNLWPRPSSCLVPMGGRLCLHRLWKVKLAIGLKYMVVGVSRSMSALLDQCVYVGFTMNPKCLLQ